jgi:excinuclease ABC subunit A
MLLTVLHRLRDHGNTVVVIEHNLDVIKTADWIIDLGPEGGGGGGQIVVEGTPDEIAACPASYTGKYLRPVLDAESGPRVRPAGVGSGTRAARTRKAAGDLIG